MEKESLETVQNKIADMLNNSDIPVYDKIELLINLVHFLNPGDYENNIKVLQKTKDDDIIK